MSAQVLLPIILLVPLLGAIVTGLLRNRVSKSTVAVLACGAVLIAFLATLASLWVRRGAPDGVLHATLTNLGPLAGMAGLLGDQLSLWWLFIIDGVGLLIHIYSIGYMHDDKSFGRFFAELNYFIFAMTLLVLSDNYIGLLAGWANVGLASYLLIGFYIEKPAAALAARKAFVMNVLGEAVMAVGVYVLFQQFGDLHFHAIFQALPEYLNNPLGAGTINTICLLLIVGAVAKSAQLPLHTWLPDAMQGPTPVSALIHAATMVTAGVYLILRSYPLFEAAPNAALLVAWIGALGALFGSLVALGQTDIKRILAFSTMSQIGYMFLAAGIGAYSAAAFHFFTHAFFKALLFLAAGVIIHNLHGEQDIRRMGGLGKKMKFAYWTYLAGTLALMGVPLFSGFFSKDEILGAALHHGHYALWAVALVAAGITALYNMRMFLLVFAGEEAPMVSYRSGKRNKRQVQAEHAHHHTPASMAWPVGLLAAAAVIAGYMGIPHVYNFPETYLGHVFEAFSLHAGEAAAESLATLFTGMGAALAVVATGAGVGYLLWGPRGRLRAAARDMGEPNNVLYKMFYFDEIYEFTFVSPVWTTSQWVAESADPRGIDGLLHGLGNLAVWLGKGVRAAQSGFVRRYALLAFVGLVAMIGYYVVYLH